MALSKATTVILLLTIVLICLPAETYAFGAGDIPDFAYLNNKAYRHGDIESILEDLVKYAGSSEGGGLLGFASSLITAAAGGAKFSKSDVKKVYFGNWLRDYSQAMDIAGLSKLTADTLVLVVSVLGFMTFGFATEEFEVTANRLGVYLPVEHIDNPKGYAATEPGGDARQYHPKLRPPVNPQELEIDPNTGMKCYMATENQGWDTSTAHIRRVFRECIEQGRRAGGQGGPNLWDAYRNLGSGLHTMEDLLAHSNWCEVALRKLGYDQVFCHVGDNVVIDVRGESVPPLVTGTFGGADFLHSLVGEATDKLSQASVTDLNDKMNEASQGGTANIDALRNILSKLPIGGGSEDKMAQGEQFQAQSQAYNFDPDNIAPPEVQQQFFDLLKWRDGVYRDIVSKIESVPGLATLLEELTNALNAYVFTVIAPYVTPLMQQATGVLDEGSKAVVDSNAQDQYEVFNDPNASDPSHSLLSKDHFGLILNEPAGQIAQIVVKHSVNLIVRAWSDDSNPDEVIDKVLEAFHHPYYATGYSGIQQEMFTHMEIWIQGLGSEKDNVIDSLTKDSVKAGRNKRSTEGQDQPGQSHAGSYGAAYGGGQSTGRVDSYGGQNTGYGGSYGRQDTETGNGGSYGRQDTDTGYGGSYERQDTGHDGSYEGHSTSHGRNDEYNSGYGGGDDSGSRHEGYNPGYGRQEAEEFSSGGGRNRRDDYEGGEEEQGSHHHGSRRHHGGEYGESAQYGYNRGSSRDEDSYARSGDSGYQPSYGRNQENEGYGGGHSGYQPSYGGRDDSSYGMDNLDIQDDDRESYETRRHRSTYGDRAY